MILFCSAGVRPRHVSSACADDKSSTAAKPVAAKPARCDRAGAAASYVQTTGSS